MSIQDRAKAISDSLDKEKRAATKEEGLILLTATLENKSTELIQIMMQGWRLQHKELEYEIATQILEKRGIPRGP